MPPLRPGTACGLRRADSTYAAYTRTTAIPVTHGGYDDEEWSCYDRRYGYVLCRLRRGPAEAGRAARAVGRAGDGEGQGAAAVAALPEIPAGLHRVHVQPEERHARGLYHRGHGGRPGPGHGQAGHRPGVRAGGLPGRHDRPMPRHTAPGAGGEAGPGGHCPERERSRPGDGLRLDRHGPAWGSRGPDGGHRREDVLGGVSAQESQTASAVGTVHQAPELRPLPEERPGDPAVRRPGRPSGDRLPDADPRRRRRQYGGHGGRRRAAPRHPRQRAVRVRGPRARGL